MALAFQSHSYLTPCSKAHGGPVRPAHVPPRAVLGRRGVLDGPGWRILCASGFLPAGLHSLRARRKTQLTSRLPATRRLAEQGGPPAGEQEAFEELAEWLRSRGAYINKAVGLTDSDRDGQRGCVATTEIRVGELLLETRCVSGSKQGTDQQQH
ncbi:Histone-lysine N-methyltransferase setd3 [Durusdinium trenchii]|uniref:Histone-lysine N-methyltransferase setd3 n=1 Tax=Durusdinium trenchii TaxID=1381693 RepID=A0ABP0QRX1_9DINO